MISWLYPVVYPTRSFWWQTCSVVLFNIVDFCGAYIERQRQVEETLWFWYNPELGQISYWLIKIVGILVLVLSAICSEMKMKWKIDTLEMFLIALKIYFVPWCDNWLAIRQTEDSVCKFKKFSFYMIMLSNSDMALRSAVFLLFSPSLYNHLASSRTLKSWKFATTFSWRYAFYIFSLMAEYSNSCFLKSVI